MNDDSISYCEINDDDSLIFQRDNNKTLKEKLSKPKISLLSFEQSLILKSFSNDALFISEKGLGLEHLFLQHILLFNYSHFLIFVINTRHDDEHYFLGRLTQFKKECLPKLISASVSPKERMLIYKTGGIQFITSRILIVDFLTKRVPIDKVSGIFVYRAHELLTSFQESFILNVFRKQRNNGFIKAFTDEPTRIVNMFGNNLSLLVDKLCGIKNIFFVSRNTEEIKKCFNGRQLKISNACIPLYENEEKIRKNLFALISTCVRELMQCSIVDNEIKHFLNGDQIICNSLIPTSLEIFLRQKTLNLSERQMRILNDLKMLRILLQKVEDLDPSNVLYYATKIRNEKHILEKNSGWVFTPDASAVFKSIDALCFDEYLTNLPFCIKPPTKWLSLISILKKLSQKVMRKSSDNINDKGLFPCVLVLASNEKTCRQLIDLSKFGKDRLLWMLSTSLLAWRQNRNNSVNSNVNCLQEPDVVPLWNPVYISFYDNQISLNNYASLVKVVQDIQKKAGRETSKKGPQRLLTEKTKSKCMLERQRNLNKKIDSLDTNVNNILSKVESRLNRLAAPTSAVKISEQCQNDKNTFFLNNVQIFNNNPTYKSFCLDYFFVQNEEKSLQHSDSFSCSTSQKSSSVVYDVNLEDSLCDLNAMLIFLSIENRYNLLNCLDNMQPHYVVFYDVDVKSMRIIETFNVHNPLQQIKVYSLVSPLPEKKENLINENHDYNSGIISTEEKRVFEYEHKEKISFNALFHEFENLKFVKPVDVNNLVEKEENCFDKLCSKTVSNFSNLHHLACDNNLFSLKHETKKKLLSKLYINIDKLKTAELDHVNTKLINCNQSKNCNLRTNKKFRSERCDLPRIIVDMREFNSELPTVLYKRGVCLEAVTIEVGDYILTPEICVERKGLDDLAQSLNSGRIFKQIEEMFRHYPRVVLLVESSDKFRTKRVSYGSFQGNLWRQSRETRLLLTILIRSNPRLKLMWSVSPTQSAELFDELKIGRLNPDIKAATSIRCDDWVAEINNMCELNDSSVDIFLNNDQFLLDNKHEPKAHKTNLIKNNLNNFKTSRRKSCNKKKKINPVVKRQLLQLPFFSCDEVENIMHEIDNYVSKLFDDCSTKCDSNETSIYKSVTLIDFIELPLLNDCFVKSAELNTFFTTDFLSFNLKQ